MKIKKWKKKGEMKEFRVRTFSTTKHMMNWSLSSKQPINLSLNGRRGCRFLMIRIRIRRWRWVMAVNLLADLLHQRLHRRLLTLRFLRHCYKNENPNQTLKRRILGLRFSRCPKSIEVCDSWSRERRVLWWEYIKRRSSLSLRFGAKPEGSERIWKSRNLTAFRFGRGGGVQHKLNSELFFFFVNVGAHRGGSVRGFEKVSPTWRSSMDEGVSWTAQ